MILGILYPMIPLLLLLLLLLLCKCNALAPADVMPTLHQRSEP